jgi:superfamily I DNA and/or RNA helicase
MPFQVRRHADRTVDKFQEQEAAIVIVSVTTSMGTEAPHGTEFLVNPNRFNRREPRRVPGDCRS